MNIAQVGTQGLVDIWPIVGPYISKAIEKSQHKVPLDSVRVDVVNGHQQLWIAYNSDNKIYGCCTTQIMLKHPEEYYMKLVYVAGYEMPVWMDTMFEALKGYALEKGCKYIDAEGRKAWWKHYRLFGFREVYTTFRKDLTDIVRH